MRAITLSLAITSVALLGQPNTVRAQAVEPLITDRPDQTESASVVGSGVVQFEGGWTFAQDEAVGSRSRDIAVPALLVRLGIAPSVEGRLGFAGWQRSELRNPTGQTTTTSGLGDLDLGFKYKLLDARGAVPDLALIGAVTLPTGAESFRTERAAPAIRLAAAHRITERLGLGYNAGATWTSELDAAGRQVTFVDGLYTLVVGMTITDRLSAFVESFGSLALDNAGVTHHLVDFGFTYLLNADLQLDASAGYGLSDGAGDWFMGAGVAVRVR